MRIIVEHPETGRRIAIDERDFDTPDSNPLNQPHEEYRVNFADWEATPDGKVTDHPGRTGLDRQSLKAEGYRPVACQDDESRETPLPEGYRPPGGS